MNNKAPATADTARSMVTNAAVDSALPPKLVGSRLAWCALAVALLVAGGSGYWINRVYLPAQARVEDALASSDRGYTGLGGELHALHEKLQTTEATLVARDAQLTALTSDVAKLTTQLATSSAPVTSLRRARVVHLVKTADFSLRVMRDRRAADAALSAAHAELDGNLPVEAALQQILRSDQSALAAVIEPEVDVLNAEWVEYAHQLMALPWQGTASTPAARAAPRATTADWRGVAAAIWHDLLNLVEIRTTTEVDVTRLDPAREALLKAGLQAEIVLLRSALQRRATAAAHTSVASLRNSLDTYYKADDPALAPLRAALKRLAETELAPTLPSLAASLRGLETLQQAALSTTPAPEEPTAPSAFPPPSAPTGDPREFM